MEWDQHGEKRTYAKVTWRLVPFLFLCYVFAYLDRVNIGFAKLQMMADRGWSDTVYGLGAGIFFIGYFLFEVPSNLLLHRVGARRWIARIMVTWGLISMAMAWVRTAEGFYALRFLLGIAEAGFFPGIILYFTYWYPPPQRARIVALFFTAVSVSGVIGGPLSGGIMQSCHGLQGWQGWQWLFVLEGLPSIGMGLVVLVFLDDSIRGATWLTEEEKQLLERNLAIQNQQARDLPLRQMWGNGTVWLFSAIYFSFVLGLYGVGFWLPQLIENTGVKNLWHVGLFSAIPYGLATVVMVLLAWHSDHTGERRWHVIGSAVTGAGGLLLTGLYSSQTGAAVAALSLATAGILTALAIFWVLPTNFLKGTAAAVGIAMINSLGNLAGFVSPYLVGVMRDHTGTTAPGLYVMAVSLLIGAVLVGVATRGNERLTWNIQRPTSTDGKD